MKYYSFHVGDFIRDTAHLTPIEDVIYRRLIDLYYMNEKPIPNETQTVSRKIRMVSEQETIALILEEFFILGDDNYWHNERCDQEIEKYQAKCELNKRNGKKGGRPKKQTLSNNKNPDGFQTVSKKNHNQEPITINQEPINNILPIGNSENSDESESFHDDFFDEKIIPIGKPPRKSVPVKKIVDLYHEILPELPRFEKLTKTREGLIRQRWLEDLPDLEEWREYFEYIRASPFLMGKIDPGPGKKIFRADLEWITRPSNFAKIAERKYHG